MSNTNPIHIVVAVGVVLPLAVSFLFSDAGLNGPLSAYDVHLGSGANVASAELVLGDDASFNAQFDSIDCDQFNPNKYPLTNATCGYVTVPEFHNQPQENTIQIGVMVLKRTGYLPATDPLFMENGGPGGATIAVFPSYFSVSKGLSALQEHRDIVFVDQRGTQYSIPYLNCTDDDAKNASDSKTFLQTCKARWESQGVNFDAYDSVENAKDMILVANALGYDKINLYGVSYGSELAQHVMRVAPERLRTVILDGVDPINVNGFSHAAAAGSHALRQLFAACALDVDCAKNYPNLETTFFDLVDALNQSPVVIKTADGTEEQLTGNELIYAIFEKLYQASSDTQLPQLIHNLAKQDDILRLHTPSKPVASSSDGIATAMGQAVYCAHKDPPDVGFTMNDAFDQLTQAIRATEQYLCDVFDVDPLPADTYGPITLGIPTLIMNGQYDPILPMPFGLHVAASFPNAYVFSYPGAGHGSLFYTDCPPSMLASFLNQPGQAPDDSCIASMTTEFRGPIIPLADLQLVARTVDAVGVKTVIPEQWEAFKPNIFLDKNDEGSFTTGVLVFEVFPTLSEATSKLQLDNVQPEQTDQTIGNHSWSIYQRPLSPGLQVNVTSALTSVEGKVYSVALVAAAGTQQAVMDKLWQPVLENFEVLQTQTTN